VADATDADTDEHGDPVVVVDGSDMAAPAVDTTIERPVPSAATDGTNYLVIALMALGMVGALVTGALMVRERQLDA